MPGVRVGVASFSRRKNDGERTLRDQERARHEAVHAKLFTVARAMVVSWQREGRGLYRINPAIVLALCEAIDRSDVALNGGGTCE
jgi:hypothetical protein